MFRKYFIGKYVNMDDVQAIIGHSPAAFVGGAALYLLLLFLTYVGYAIWHQYSQETYIQWIAASLGVFLFVKWAIAFLNQYLDCMLLSKGTLSIFLREGVLEYQTEVLDWSKIQTISHRQNSFWDRIFSKGDLLIRLDNDIEFPFENVTNPKKQATKILLLKEEFLQTQKIKIEKDLADENGRFEILVDALGEVIKEYMDGKEEKYEGYDE